MYGHGTRDLFDGGYAVDPSTGEEYEYQESKSAEHPIDRYYAGMLSCGLDGEHQRPCESSASADRHHALLRRRCRWS